MLPGVGAFADCMRGPSAVPGMVEALRERCLKEGAPFLGICVGMQLLATVGREFGDHAGLGWIAGEVVKIAPIRSRAQRFRIWAGTNSDRAASHPLLAGIARRRPRLFRAFLSVEAGAAGRSAGHHRLWRAAHRR